MLTLFTWTICCSSITSIRGDTADCLVCQADQIFDSCALMKAWLCFVVFSALSSVLLFILPCQDSQSCQWCMLTKQPRVHSAPHFFHLQITSHTGWRQTGSSHENTFLCVVARSQSVAGHRYELDGRARSGVGSGSAAHQSSWVWFSVEVFLDLLQAWPGEGPAGGGVAPYKELLQVPVASVGASSRARSKFLHHTSQLHLINTAIWHWHWFHFTAGIIVAFIYFTLCICHLV